MNTSFVLSILVVVLTVTCCHFFHVQSQEQIQSNFNTDIQVTNGQTNTYAFTVNAGERLTLEISPREDFTFKVINHGSTSPAPNAPYPPQLNNGYYYFDIIVGMKGNQVPKYNIDMKYAYSVDTVRSRNFEEFTLKFALLKPDNKWQLFFKNIETNTITKYVSQGTSSTRNLTKEVSNLAVVGKEEQFAKLGEKYTIVPNVDQYRTILKDNGERFGFAVMANPKEETQIEITRTNLFAYGAVLPSKIAADYPGTIGFRIDLGKKTETKMVLEYNVEQDGIVDEVNEVLHQNQDKVTTCVKLSKNRMFEKVKTTKKGNYIMCEPTVKEKENYIYIVALNGEFENEQVFEDANSSQSLSSAYNIFHTISIMLIVSVVIILQNY